MAEFKEAMKQAKRMCVAQGCSCGECGLHKKYNLCPLCAHQDDLIPADWELSNLNDIERIVMEWAATYEEPKYPTWTEWLRTFSADGVDLYAPIPADIAERLGIKPIGGGRNE